ncbi:MAG TPA: heavy metal-associated domain-containing protein, partial [Thermoanaerobaculia bacterium]|nr:heavy metal-associated domain-containing protein [Thermoanaerobaculia bacterium]
MSPTTATPERAGDAAPSGAAPEPASGRSGRSGERLQRLDLPLTGMTCAACAARIQKKLGRTEGVAEAQVNFATERATVRFDPERIHAAGLVTAIEAAGYGARLEETVLQVAGLEWAASGTRVERELMRLAGVVSAQVNLAAGTARVLYVPEATPGEELAGAVEASGYRLAAPVAAT